MLSDTSRKCKALFIIAILAVAEGRRIEPSYRAVRSDENGPEAEFMFGSNQVQEPTRVHLELDVLSKDPAFRQQLEAMAGHMEAFADLVNQNPKILARATAIAKEMFALSADPSYAEASTLPEQMEGMIADLDFQEVAQMVADDMEPMLKANTDFQDEFEATRAAMSSEQTSALVSEKVTEVMSDPDFQRRSERVSESMESLMQDADLQREAEAIAQQMEDPDMAEKVGEQLSAVMSDPKFREKASNAILEMFSAELTEKLGSNQAGLEELLNVAQSPSAFNPGFAAGRQSARAPQMARSLGPKMDAKEPESQPAERMFQGSEGDKSALTTAKGIRGMMPSLMKVLPRWGKGAVMEAKKGGVDVALLLCFALWYLGNYYYNISNKLALVAAGGAAGFPMTIATLQLGVGVIYALFLWIAPDARTKPAITFKDYVATLPVGAMTAGAHAASVFALGAGAVSFAQIVKAAEPAFAAVIGTLAYGVTVSTAKWLSLIPVIGGVCLASLGELSFAWSALITASIANIFAAVKGNENAKLMSTPGIADRLGTVENQFALTTINAFLFTLPLMLLTEGKKLGAFVELMKTSPVLFNNVIGSGLWFYLYNELATKTIKKTNAVTQSVANTAKRVIVIVVVAIVMQEGLSPLKLAGSGIGIAGVFLYSIIDKLLAGKKKEE